MNEKRDFFAEFIRENDLVQTISTSDLRDVSGRRRLLIDGNVLSAELRSHVRKQEPLWVLSGGVPVSLHPFIEAYVRGLQGCELEPVVVFDGMPVAPFYDPQFTQPACNAKADALGEVMQPKRVSDLSPQAAASLEGFANAVTFGEDVTVALIAKLRTLKVEVWRAPYLAMAQIAAFMAESHQYAREALGPLELLMMPGMERVVISIDAEKQTAGVVSKEAVLAKVQSVPECGKVTESDVLNAIIFSMKGITFAEDAVPLLTEPVQSFVHLLRKVAPSLTNQPLQSALAPHTAQRFHFWRMRAAFHCTPVLHVSGTCVPLSKLFPGKQTYSALADCFGLPMPPLFYYFVATGLLSPSIVHTVATRRIVDKWPIVESREFDQATEYIIPLRTQIVYQLIELLQSNMQASSLNELMWMRPNIMHRTDPSGHLVPIIRPPPIKLDQWELSGVSEEIDDSFNFSSVLNHSNNASMTATYSTAAVAHTAIHLKALDLLGYFTHATHDTAEEESGPSIYTYALESCKPSLSHLGVLLIELVRTRALSDEPLHLMGTKASDHRSLEEGMNFLVRIASMVPIALKGAWTGPVSASLLAFNQMLCALQHTLRGLLEVIAVTLFFSDGAHPGGMPSNTFGVESYIDFAERLPFRVPPGTHGGIIMHFAVTDETFFRCTTRDAALMHLKKAFPECVNIESDLKSMFDLVCSAHNIIKKLSDDDPATFHRVFSTIFKASQLMKTRLKVLKLEQSSACA